MPAPKSIDHDARGQRVILLCQPVREFETTAPILPDCARLRADLRQETPRNLITVVIWIAADVELGIGDFTITHSHNHLRFAALGNKLGAFRLELGEGFDLCAARQKLDAIDVGHVRFRLNAQCVFAGGEFDFSLLGPLLVFRIPTAGDFGKDGLDDMFVPIDQEPSRARVCCGIAQANEIGRRPGDFELVLDEIILAARIGNDPDAGAVAIVDDDNVALRKLFRLPGDRALITQLLFCGRDLFVQGGDLRVGVSVGCFEIRREQRGVPDRRAVKDAGERVVILVRDRVKFVIMTARTTESHRHDCATEGVDLLVDDVGAFFDRVFFGEDFRADGEEAGRGEIRFGQEIASELFAQEDVVGQIAIEGVDDVVAIAERIRVRVVLVTAVGITVAGNVEPVSPPAFAVMRGGEEFVDDVFEGIRIRIRDEGFHLCWCRWQTDEIEIGAADERAAIRF